MKASFKHACDFMMEDDVSGAGKAHHLLVKKFEPEISVRSKQRWMMIHAFKIWRISTFMIYQEPAGRSHLIGQCRKMACMKVLILKITLKSHPEKHS
jgi:hypothetical protein